MDNFVDMAGYAAIAGEINDSIYLDHFLCFLEFADIFLIFFL